jgi:hypothetical protein
VGLDQVKYASCVKWVCLVEACYRRVNCPINLDDKG